MKIEIDGRARRLGDDINTDYIISSSRKKETLDPDILRRYLLESVNPGFAASVVPGDVLVAGRNFGCGSAMEVAVTVVVAAGIRAVLALSFARTYYRNAINNGLIPVECDTGGIHEGDRLTIPLEETGARVANQTQKTIITGLPLPAVMLAILGEGGLVAYFRKHRDFPASTTGPK
jgi:3-isopropylmalate/(R)-2-methylmalate dehydratase small subunit